jgi:hypothetical protein
VFILFLVYLIRETGILVALFLACRLWPLVDSLDQRLPGGRALDDWVSTPSALATQLFVLLL